MPDSIIDVETVEDTMEWWCHNYIEDEDLIVKSDVMFCGDNAVQRITTACMSSDATTISQSVLKSDTNCSAATTILPPIDSPPYIQPIKRTIIKLPPPLNKTVSVEQDNPLPTFIEWVTNGGYTELDIGLEECVKLGITQPSSPDSHTQKCKTPFLNLLRQARWFNPKLIKKNYTTMKAKRTMLDTYLTIKDELTNDINEDEELSRIKREIIYKRSLPRHKNALAHYLLGKYLCMMAKILTEKEFFEHLINNKACTFVTGRIYSKKIMRFYILCLTFPRLKYISYNIGFFISNIHMYEMQIIKDGKDLWGCAYMPPLYKNRLTSYTGGKPTEQSVVKRPQYLFDTHLFIYW